MLKEPRKFIPPVIGFLLLLLLITPSTAGNTLTVTGQVIGPEAPVADFTANRTDGYAPFAVRFTDLSTGSPTEWEWDFENDGTTDDSVPEPVHIYLVPGVYDVSLTVRNSLGVDSEIKHGYIIVHEQDAGARIELLIDYVGDLHIPHWARWFVAKPLEQALFQLEKGHVRPAVNQMRVFIRLVDLMSRFSVLTPTQAGYLTGEAEAIIDLIKG